MKGKMTNKMKKSAMPEMKKGGAVKKMKKSARDMGKVEGKKAMKRLDRKARGGKVDGRPNAEGMTAENPMSNASKTEKDVSGEDDRRGYKSGGALAAKERNKIPGKDFALQGRRYPIEDKAHARNALARVSQNGSSEEKAKVRAKVMKKYPGIKQRD